MFTSGDAVDFALHFILYTIIVSRPLNRNHITLSNYQSSIHNWNRWVWYSFSQFLFELDGKSQFHKREIGKKKIEIKSSNDNCTFQFIFFVSFDNKQKFNCISLYTWLRFSILSRLDPLTFSKSKSTVSLSLSMRYQHKSMYC